MSNLDINQYFQPQFPILLFTYYSLHTEKCNENWLSTHQFCYWWSLILSFLLFYGFCCHKASVTLFLMFQFTVKNGSTSCTADFCINIIELDKLCSNSRCKQNVSEKKSKPFFKTYLRSWIRHIIQLQPNDLNQV